jgi:hypothetical protein
VENGGAGKHLPNAASVRQSMRLFLRIRFIEQSHRVALTVIGIRRFPYDACVVVRPAAFM